MSGKTQEYPKALYADGQLEGHTVVVFNADEEAIKREEGYKSLNESDDHAEKDALIEEAKALGIAATKNWGIEKLQAEIAKAKAE